MKRRSLLPISFLASVALSPIGAHAQQATGATTFQDAAGNTVTVTSRHVAPAQEDLHAEFAALDSDGDGGLSTDEISTAISNAASDSASTQAMRGPPPGPPPSGGAGGSSGVFESLDANQDGVVSTEELVAANGSDSTDASSAASDLIKAADQDGDGSLSGGEFYAMLDQGKDTTSSTDAPRFDSAIQSHCSSVGVQVKDDVKTLTVVLGPTKRSSNTSLSPAV